MSRSKFLVAYDVSCSFRLRRVATAVRAYRAEGQRSVAECWMTSAECESLMRALLQEIDESEDRLHMVRLDPRQEPLLFGVARSSDGGPFVIA